MNIIYYHPLFNAGEWLAGIKQRLPQARSASGSAATSGRPITRWCGARRTDAGQPPRSESGVRPRRRR